jgi:hypothetical protein
LPKIQKRVGRTIKIQKMKRLKLDDFKLKNLKEETTVTDKLLGQALSDCHDEIGTDIYGNTGSSSDVPSP